MTGREPGFAGMIAAGVPPADAWQQIRDELTAKPEVLAILRGLDADSLEWSRQGWARHGLAPPWEGLL